MAGVTYLYQDGCPSCADVLPNLQLRMKVLHVDVTIRKPYLAELKELPGVPALVIPQQEGQPPVVLVGSRLVDAVDARPELFDWVRSDG